VGALESFEALKEKQEAEAAKLSAQASLAASRPLSTSTIAAATKATRDVAEDRGRGGLAEPAADLQDLRKDAAFTGGLMKDVRLAESQAHMLLAGALMVGYRTQVEGTKLAKGVRLVYTPDPATTAAVQSYPILGETAAEHAHALADALRRDTLRAVGLPLTGQASYELIAEALGAVATQHSTRVGSAVAEAYFAGVQAGFIDAGRALVHK